MTGVQTCALPILTREIQSYLNQEDHDAKVAQEVSILEQTILMQKRVNTFQSPRSLPARFLVVFLL